MNREQRIPGGGRRVWFALAAVVLLVGGYFAVMAAVRSHVSGLIAEQVGQPLPAFALPRADGGGTLADTDLRGRPFLLHFFRSHCESCEAEAPALRALEAELGPGQRSLVHVMTDRVMDFAPADTAATLARKAFQAPVLMADGAFMDAFHSVTWSRVTPVTYGVDASGVIRVALRGRQDLASLRAALAACR